MALGLKASVLAGQ